MNMCMLIWGKKVPSWLRCFSLSRRPQSARAAEGCSDWSRQVRPCLRQQCRLAFLGLFSQLQARKGLRDIFSSSKAVYSKRPTFQSHLSFILCVSPSPHPAWAEVRKLAEVQPLVEAVQATGGCEQRLGPDRETARRDRSLGAWR